MGDVRAPNDEEGVRAMRTLLRGMTNQRLGKFIGDVLDMSPSTPRTLVMAIEELATRAKRVVDAL